VNIKIATFFFGNNYGALLQAYYLKKFVEDKFIDKKIDFFKYQPKKFIFREEYSPIIKKNPLKMFEGLIKFRKLRKWKKKNISPNFDYKKKLDISNKGISIYGSDEIWNFSNPFFGYDNFFFGKNDYNYKISYAASLGTAKIDNTNIQFKEEIKNLLTKFSYVSVRDKHSWEILKSEFNLKSEIVLDPIHLINDNLSNNEEKRNIKNKCIIYGNHFSKQQIKKIIDYCNLKKLEILSVGYYNKWANNNINLDPFEYLKEIKDSKIIFTSMFHGVQFAVKYKKNFWYSIDPYRINKLEYFLSELNLKIRMISDDHDFDEEIDYISLEDKLNKWKIFSKEFLIKSINSLDN